MIKKTLILVYVILFMILLSGCTDKGNKTLIFLKSYNKLENPPGQNLGGDFTFEVNHKRYEVMDGYTAMHLQIIDEEKNRAYKVIMADSNRKKVFSIETEKEYQIGAVRACTDIDGSVYILYSKWDTLIGNLFIEELKSSYILEMNMEQFKVEKQFDFGAQIVVLTVHDGYVYTMEDGKIYRKLLDEAGNKECMADLGYRGIPNKSIYEDMTFYINYDGIMVKAHIPDDKAINNSRNEIIADIKYVDNLVEIR